MNEKRGFTIVELFIVIAITFVVGVFVFPVSISFLQSQVLDEGMDGMVSILRKAQGQAMHEKHDNSFGVKVLTHSYVLFEGPSYALRTESEDEIFQLADAVDVGGLNEVVFAKGSGVPGTEGIITLSVEGKQGIIDINEQGKIEQ